MIEIIWNRSGIAGRPRGAPGNATAEILSHGRKGNLLPFTSPRSFISEVIICSSEKLQIEAQIGQNPQVPP
jgi:hypothetical protein